MVELSDDNEDDMVRNVGPRLAVSVDEAPSSSVIVVLHEHRGMLVGHDGEASGTITDEMVDSWTHETGSMIAAHPGSASMDAESISSDDAASDDAYDDDKADETAGGAAARGSNRESMKVEKSTDMNTPSTLNIRGVDGSW